jgi:hypothetical protein
LEVTLAAAGGRYAAAAPTAIRAGPGLWSCALSVLDLVADEPAGELPLGGPRELLHSLAVGDTSGGPVAFTGLWHSPDARSGERTAGHGAVVALALDTGAEIGSAPLPGVPEQLALAAGPGRWGNLLYCVEGSPGPELRDLPGSGPGAPSWRLLALDPSTLQVERAYELAHEPCSFAVAPDGEHAYALTLYSVLHTELVAIDLRNGTARPLARLPAESVGNLMVTEQHVYVPHTFGSSVWALHRRTGRLAQTIRVGRHPTAIALGRA